MAIDRTGQVTTTGLMGGEPKLPKAPDMSNLTPPASAQAPKIPKGIERLFVGNISPTIAIEIGIKAPAPTAWNILAAINK